MNITVYCGSNFGDNPHFEEAAHDLGAWIARAGHTLVYGGSSVGTAWAPSPVLPSRAARRSSA